MPELVPIEDLLPWPENLDPKPWDDLERRQEITRHVIQRLLEQLAADSKAAIKVFSQLKIQLQPPQPDLCAPLFGMVAEANSRGVASLLKCAPAALRTHKEWPSILNGTARRLSLMPLAGTSLTDAST